MDGEKSLDVRAAEVVGDNTREIAKLLAEVRGTSYHTADLSPGGELWSWMFEDEAAPPRAELIAQGIPPIEAEFIRRPLKKRLIRQAGLTFKEQKAYCRRMTEREQQARMTGRLPQPPERPESGAGLGSQSPIPGPPPKPSGPMPGAAQVPVPTPAPTMMPPQGV